MSPEAVGKRLFALRRALDLTQAEMADQYGFTPSNWANYENGYPFPATSAIQLVSKINGLSFDFIYRGDYLSLSQALAQKIREATAPTLPGRRNRRAG